MQIYNMQNINKFQTNRWIQAHPPPHREIGIVSCLKPQLLVLPVQRISDLLHLKRSAAYVKRINIKYLPSHGWYPPPPTVDLSLRCRTRSGRVCNLNSTSRCSCFCSICPSYSDTKPMPNWLNTWDKIPKEHLSLFPYIMSSRKPYGLPPTSLSYASRKEDNLALRRSL